MKTSHPHFKKAEHMRNAYDGTAEFYDSRYKYIQYLKYGISLYTLIDPISLPQIAISGPILDNGGGTGLFLNFLNDLSSFLANEKGEDEKVQLILEFTCYLIERKLNKTLSSIFINPVIICDISFEMLRVAYRYQDSRELYGLVACDSTNLPFRSSQFSTILAFTVFQNIKDVEQALAESSRVITEEGQLTMSILEKSENKPKFGQLMGKYFQQIKTVPFEEERVKFQKIIVQSDKYSQLYDLEKVEDFFLTAKKTPRTKQ